MQSSQKRRRSTLHPLSQQIDRTRIEYIKEMADPELIAASLGIMFAGRRGRYLRTACPIHGGNDKTAFSLDTQTGCWTCFSGGCHQGYADLIGLVERIRRCNFIEAVLFIAGVMGIDTEPRSDEIKSVLYRKDMKELINKSQKSSLETNLCTISNIEELVYEWVANRSNYFVERGYTASILDYFEIGSSCDHYGIPREVIPIRDSNSRIVAVDGRRTDSDESPRYFINPPGFPKGKYLYHYHKARDYASLFNGQIFIVEGYKACWSMVQAGFLSTVACMGAGFMGEQAGVILQNMDIKRVIVALDGDSAGYNGARRVKSELNHICDTTIVNMPEGHDPSTLSVNELHNIISPHLN